MYCGDLAIAKGLTARAIAYSATATSSGTSLNMDWLSITWQKALQRRVDALDVLKDTLVAPMADELGFWAYRLDNVFPEDMHKTLTTMAREAFDPRTGISETMHKNTKRSNISSTTRW